MVGPSVLDDNPPDLDIGKYNYGLPTGTKIKTNYGDCVLASLDSKCHGLTKTVKEWLASIGNRETDYIWGGMGQKSRMRVTRSDLQILAHRD